LAGFFRNLVNRINNRARSFNEGAGAEGPPEPSWTVPPMEGPPPPPPPIIEEGPSNNDQVSIYDIYGTYIGTNDWSGWYESTLYNSYSSKIHLLNLIQQLEDAYYMEWDWDQWRLDYAAAHAGV
jgi:hypothetical protein